MPFPLSPSNGQIAIVNNKQYQYLTSKNAWVIIRTVGLPGQFLARQYTANGVSNTFTITSGFTANSLFVTENGVLQAPTVDYTVSNNTLTFTTTPANNTQILIRELQVIGETGATGATGATGPAIVNIPASVSGTLSVFNGTSRYYVYRTANISDIMVSFGTVPTGSNVVVRINRNGVANANVQIPSNTIFTRNTSSFFTVQQDDYLTLDIVQVGNTYPGSDMIVQLVGQTI